MKSYKTVLAAVAAALLAVGVSGTGAFGQAPPPGGDRGGDRDRGRGDPAEMRERYYGMIKEQLAVSDDEWKVLQPRIEKVSTLRRAGDSGRGGFGRGGDNNRSSEPPSPVAKAAEDLRTVTRNKEAPAAEVTAKLAALREARAKAKAELATAQKELVEVLTPKQEAVLVSMGMLE